MIEIYVRDGCQFCRKVLRNANELGLKEGKDFKIIDAAQGTHGMEVILKIGGKGQVPFLIDGKVHMYESDDINKYLDSKFSNSNSK